MNKYEYEAEKAGRVIDPAQPHTGQVEARKTRFTYENGPMYYLGEQIVKAMEDSGYPAFIWCAFRPPDKQQEYKLAGTSNAGPWQSPHQYWEAVDILHPDLHWRAPADYWEQLAACVRIVAERFDVDLEHGHYWPRLVDSAHIELKDWRQFREVIRARWRDETTQWERARQSDPLHRGEMPQPTPPTEHELDVRFEDVLPKVWAQHVRAADPSPAPEFLTRRQRRQERRQERREARQERRERRSDAWTHKTRKRGQ